MSTEPITAPTLEELAPLFPNFALNSFIAQGGMGSVYLATQISLERQVALKILPRELGRDAEFRDSFAAEAKAMAKLNHPNLVGVIDYGEVDGMPFIIMEYVPGKSLHHSANGKQIDAMEAARIVQKTLNGLHHAHTHNILHRDVKPENILLDSDNAEPKLGDFGLAISSSEGSNDSLLYGTPGYAAPEVYQGQPDARSDVYAAAVVLYELLTGKMPESPYQHPSSLSSCDQRFDALMAKALQLEGDARYQTAQEFAEALATIRQQPLVTKLATGPILSSPSQSSATRPSLTKTRPTPAKRGNGGLFATVAITLVAVVGSLTFLLTKMKSANAKTEQALIAQKQLSESSPDDAGLVFATKEEMAKKDELAPKAPSATRYQNILAEKRSLITENSGDLISRHTQHNQALQDNIEQLKQTAQKVLAQQDGLSSTVIQKREQGLAQLSTRFTNLGNLPEKLKESLPPALRNLSNNQKEMRAIVTKALESQERLNQEFDKALQPHLTKYTHTIRQEAERMEQEGHLSDADYLEKEALAAESSSTYFLAIVLKDYLQVEKPKITQKSLASKLLGDWENRTKKYSFSLLENGVAKNKNRQGTWEIAEQTITITWKQRTDTLEFTDDHYNRLKGTNSLGRNCNYSRVESLAHAK